MIKCPKCQALATPGSSDCLQCGYLFSASESTPGFSPRKVFKWWLLFYAFWRVFVLVNYGVAAHRFESGVFFYYFGAIAVLAIVSLAGIALLWQGRKVGLYVFGAGEVVSALVQALFGSYLAVIYPVVAVGIMWLVGKRAEFRRA